MLHACEDQLWCMHARTRVFRGVEGVRGTACMRCRTLLMAVIVTVYGLFQNEVSGDIHTCTPAHSYTPTAHIFHTPGLGREGGAHGMHVRTMQTASCDSTQQAFPHAWAACDE